MKKFFGVLAGAVLFLGCAGSSFDGKVNDQTLTVKDVIFGQVSVPLLGTAAIVAMSDQTGLCASLKANKIPANETRYSMVLSTTDAAGNFAAPTVGTFPVSALVSLVGGVPKSQNVAYGMFDKTDSACAEISADHGDSSGGSIKLDSYSAKEGGTASGSFDMTFKSGDSVKGTFNATFCDLPTDDTEPTCG